MALNNVYKITSAQMNQLQADTHTPKQIIIDGTTYQDDGNTVFVIDDSIITTDNDHYPTTFTWTNGTTSGPTGSLTGNNGFSAVSFGAIPAASTNKSGIVTTVAQTFLGTKTFRYNATHTVVIPGNAVQVIDSQRGQAALYPDNLDISMNGADLFMGNSEFARFNIHVPTSDGLTVPIQFKLTDAGDHHNYTLTVPYKTGTLVTEDDVPSNQSSSVIVGNAVTNINGRVFQNYTANLVTSGGYTFYQILKNGSNPTEAEAKEYMKYMTGSTYLPQYNYDFPKQTIFTFADRSTWKPQYSSNDGLRLYRLTTPLALESQIPEEMSYQDALNILESALMPSGTTVSSHSATLPAGVTVSDHNVNL